MKSPSRSRPLTATGMYSWPRQVCVVPFSSPRPYRSSNWSSKWRMSRSSWSSSSGSADSRPGAGTVSAEAGGIERSDDRRVVEQVVKRHVDAAPLPHEGDDPGDRQRVAAQLEQVVVQLDPLDPQYLLPDLADRLDQLAGGLGGRLGGAHTARRASLRGLDALRALQREQVGEPFIGVLRHGQQDVREVVDKPRGDVRRLRRVPEAADQLVTRVHELQLQVAGDAAIEDQPLDVITRAVGALAVADADRRQRGVRPDPGDRAGERYLAEPVQLPQFGPQPESELPEGEAARGFG